MLFKHTQVFLSTDNFQYDTESLDTESLLAEILYCKFNCVNLHQVS